MKYIIPAVLFCAIAIAAGCGSDTTNPPDPADCSSVADTTQPATVSFANDIFPLFLLETQGGYECNNSTCHGAPIISSEFSVSEYDSLFTQGSQARSLGLCSIKPGDPSASYFYRKISGEGGIQGDPMPFEKPAMDPADIELVRVWILEGARNN